MSNKAIMALSALAFLGLCWFCLTGNHGTGTAALPTIAPTAALAAPTFNALVSGGKITLKGTLPDQATKDGIIARAKELYGDGNFIDNLTIGNVGKPGWLASLAGLLPALKLKDRLNGGADVEAKVDGSGIVNLTGQVPSYDIRSSIYNEVSKLVPSGWKVNDLMTVLAGPALSDAALEAQTIINKEIAGKIIEFDTGKAVIRQGASGTAILDNVATILSKYNFPLEVSGHTDNVGNPASNTRLSQARADAVKAYLVSKGIAAARLTPKGYGDTRPIGDNTTTEGKQRNRRIEFGVRELKATTAETKK